MYWWNPGTGAVDEQVNPNAVDWNRRFAWTDANGDLVWQPGEQGAAPTSLAGGVGSTLLDPNLKDTRTREVAGWVDHELMPNFGIHAGVVWRRIDQLYAAGQREPPGQRLQRADRRSGIRAPTACSATATTGRTIAGFNLNPVNLAMPVVNILHNTPGKDDFYTLELSASRRSVGNWSLVRVVLVPVELRQRERVLRSEPARASGRGEPERYDQHGQRPLQLHLVGGESSRDV